MHRPAIANAFDAAEERQLVAILRLGQDEDGTHLGDRLGQNRRRQNRLFTRAVGQIPFVERDVLDADDALIGNELGDAIDEQERIAMRQNPLDRGVVEGQGDVHQIVLLRAVDWQLLTRPGARATGTCKYNSRPARQPRPALKDHFFVELHRSPFDRRPIRH